MIINSVRITRPGGTLSTGLRCTVGLIVYEQGNNVDRIWSRLNFATWGVGIQNSESDVMTHPRLISKKIILVKYIFE